MGAAGAWRTGANGLAPVVGDGETSRTGLVLLAGENQGVNRTLASVVLQYGDADVNSPRRPLRPALASSFPGGGGDSLGRDERCVHRSVVMPESGVQESCNDSLARPDVGV